MEAPLHFSRLRGVFCKMWQNCGLASPSTENPRYSHCPEVTDIANTDNIRSTDRSWDTNKLFCLQFKGNQFTTLKVIINQKVGILVAPYQPIQRHIYICSNVLCNILLDYHPKLQNWQKHVKINRNENTLAVPWGLSEVRLQYTQ